MSYLLLVLIIKGEHAEIAVQCIADACNGRGNAVYDACSQALDATTCSLEKFTRTLHRSMHRLVEEVGDTGARTTDFRHDEALPPPTLEARSTGLPMAAILPASLCT